MLDFFRISTRPAKRGVIEIYPKFIVEKSSDLMIRGGDFYAVWIDEQKLWSTDEMDALRLIDRELDIYAEKNKTSFEGNSVRILHMWDAESGMIDKWHKYCQKQLTDSFHMLDEKVIFSNNHTTKRDYASKKLSYPLEAGDFSAYDTIMSTLYSEDERKKIEWAIGSIISGDSKKLQKFLVLYGDPGTGKGTVLNIVEKIFGGNDMYCSAFDAKSLGSANNSFALEAFKSNPLVAIQHDGDLSRIEDNTRLNSLVSHELMTVNEKFKSTYSNRFNCFLFMGTNKPVKITDAKSGLLRRLIDVSPLGNKIPLREYNALMKKVDFELGAIASHCLEVYTNNKDAYEGYIPVNMLGASNDFYNFIEDSYYVLRKENGVTLKAAWEMYKTYCDDARVAYPFSQRIFREELKNYFDEFLDRYTTEDGTRVRSYYHGFKADKFEIKTGEAAQDEPAPSIIFKEQESLFDKVCADCYAQYASEDEIPKKKWENVKTKLSDIDTKKIHYVKVPENHIVIDFDIPDENGNKCFEKNLEAASKWPHTYAELSKSGQGIHLHYIYDGDVNRLSRIYGDHIEIKVFTGKSSLRRKLTKCNDIPIATINSGLPLKGEEKVVNRGTIKSEKALRTQIERHLNKEVFDSTAQSVKFIDKLLNEAYDSGMHYDISDMKKAISTFAACSSNQSSVCRKIVRNMKFKSEDVSDPVDSEDKRIVFFDIEIFPNLCLVCYKFPGKENRVIRLFNPKPTDIEDLLKYRLIGFNCRRYDNHILYGILMGYSNEELFTLSMRIINNYKTALFGEAYNLSYTDIYDFASSANKMSLKKLEIKMGIHHQELGIPFDHPVAEGLWEQVAEYCDNDVIATEAAFEYLKADWTARQILADLAGMTVNDTTNTLTTRIIFGTEKNPQSKFNYRNLAEPVTDISEDNLAFLKRACPDMMKEMFVPYCGGTPSYLPYFPGYSKKYGHSTYRGEEVGEGGYVYAEPGMYGNVALLDVASMHPHSVIAEVLFGEAFTKAFRDIVEGRVNIKHEAWDEVNSMLNGKLTPYIQKVINGEMRSKDLANALKTAINSVYGLTSAGFPNAFKDERNTDNIVAKRGALFMVDLKHAVQERGFKVAHIKTDSIKIPDATPEIIQFVMDFGKRYGYTFEHEATYERMCLVNYAVYIAKDAKDGHWTATGKQFQIPYVFKSLFTKEPIIFEDLCKTFAVTTSIYLDMNEGYPDVTAEEKELAKLESDYKKGLISDTTIEHIAPSLVDAIQKGHNYKFVGKVGQFCPMKPGTNGGLLMRRNESANSYSFAAESKGPGYFYNEDGKKVEYIQRWQESETVRLLGKEDCIDHNYYISLVNDAIGTLATYGDYYWFVSDDPYIGPEFIDGKPIYKEDKAF